MSRFHFQHPVLVACGVCCLLVVGAMSAAARQYDQPYDTSQPYDSSQPYADSEQAPGRVARLAYLSGQVQFAPAGEDNWGSVEINRPMVIGDRLLTGDDGRAALELGDASVRIDHDSAFDFLNLDENNVQIELSQGTLNLAVRQLGDGENFEVDTPTVAFVASTPGIYRIDDAPDGTGSMVSVFRGSGTVYGANGASRQVVAGTSYRFNDSTLANVDVDGLPQADDFDRFCETRDANYARYAQQQQQYIPSDMIGGDDLYQYGQWNAVPQYGNVWYPTTLPVGWAPYRYGHWAWIDPWGWTWVDNQPWGFAPFHYGRWVYARNRWGWCPGPVNVRPVYAPALVAFIGGSGLSLSLRIGGGGPVGWFPLGPRDVYVPWFHASRRYFTRVNVTNIRNVYVNKTVINNIYNDYSHNRITNIHRYNRYAYRHMPGAVTAVPRKVFTDARPVHPAVLKLDRTQLARTRVAVRPEVNPGAASLGLRRPTARPAVLRGHEPFARPVVARHAPPPRPVGFAAREKVIASQHGRPLTTTQMRDLRKTHPVKESRNERVKLVPALAGAAAGAAALDARRHGAAPKRTAEPSARAVSARPGMVRRPTEPVARNGTPAEPFKNTVHPIPARKQPAQPTRRAGELRSARFAHPSETRTLPRAQVIRPANEPQPEANERRELPVVRPVAHAPQSLDNGTQQRQRRADIQAQQQAREQQSQQQRQMQEQAQQHIRAQQTERQQAARSQARQRAREEQAQQQRQSQIQSEQRGREQQMQQQRQMQQMRMQQAQQGQREARQRTMQRPPERYTPRPTHNRAPEHRAPPPSRKHPPASSSDNQRIR